MNQIIKKLGTKRRYIRKPKCANLTGICTWDKCRCNYPLMEPETKAKIDEYLHHREKVIKRRREIELQKLDNEIDNGLCACNTCECYPVQGEYGKQKQQKAKYKKMIRLVVKIFIALPILYILFINLFGI